MKIVLRVIISGLSVLVAIAVHIAGKELRYLQRNILIKKNCCYDENL